MPDLPERPLKDFPEIVKKAVAAKIFLVKLGYAVDDVVILFTPKKVHVLVKSAGVNIPLGPHQSTGGDTEAQSNEFLRKLSEMTLSESTKAAAECLPFQEIASLIQKELKKIQRARRKKKPPRKWHPKNYPILLHKVIAVSLLLEKLGFEPGPHNLKVNFSSWSGTVLFIHQDKVAQFHAGVPDRNDRAILKLLGPCFEEWNLLAQKEKEAYWDYIPYDIMRPLVETELRAQGLLPPLEGPVVNYPVVSYTVVV